MHKRMLRNIKLSLLPSCLQHLFRASDGPMGGLTSLNTVTSALTCVTFFLTLLMVVRTIAEALYFMSNEYISEAPNVSCVAFFLSLIHPCGGLMTKVSSITLWHFKRRTLEYLIYREREERMLTSLMVLTMFF